MCPVYAELASETSLIEQVIKLKGKVNIPVRSHVYDVKN